MALLGIILQILAFSLALSPDTLHVMSVAVVVTNED